MKLLKRGIGNETKWTCTRNQLLKDR